MANRFTKTTRTQQEILNLIARDQMKRGDRLPPEKELEKAIGVSIITVRRALAELTERGLIERIQGKGTFLLQDAASFRSQGTIGFLLVDRPTSLYEHTLEEARKAARARSYELKLMTTGPSPDAEVTADLQGVHGAIITGFVTDEWMEWLDMMHLTTVVVGIHRLVTPAWTVQHDFENAMACIVDRLVSRGCRRIGFINAARRYLPAHHMYSGFCEAMDRHQLPWSDEDIVWCQRHDRLADLEAFFLADQPAYDALVVESGCLRALLMFMYEHEEIQGRPRLGLIGADMDRPRRLTLFDLVQFQQGIGEAGVDLLFEAMSTNGNGVRTVRIAPALVD